VFSNTNLKSTTNAASDGHRRPGGRVRRLRSVRNGTAGRCRTVGSARRRRRLQVEISANVPGPTGGGSWYWLELDKDVGIYAGSDCAHGGGARPRPAAPSPGGSRATNS
jgi:hypothetical protein